MTHPTCSSMGAKEERDEWMCGYAAAVAAVQRLYREHTIARQVMICDGVTPEKLEAAGVEEFDMKEIRKAWKHG